MSTNQQHFEPEPGPRERIMEEVTGTEERPLRMGLILRTLITLFYTVLVTVTAAVFFPLNYWFSEVSDIDPVQVTEDIWTFIIDTPAGNVTLLSTLVVTALLYWFLVFRLQGNTAFLQGFSASLVTAVLHPVIYIVLAIWNVTTQGGHFSYAVFLDELGTVALTGFFTGLFWGIIFALVFRSRWRYSVKHVRFHRVPATDGQAADDAAVRSYDPLHGAPDSVDETTPDEPSERPAVSSTPEQLTPDEYLARLRAAGARPDELRAAQGHSLSSHTGPGNAGPKRPPLKLSFAIKVLAALGFALLFELLGHLGKAAFYDRLHDLSFEYFTDTYWSLHFYHPIHHQMALLSVLVAAGSYYLLVFIWPRLNTFTLRILAGGLIGLIVHALSQLNTMLVLSDLFGVWDEYLPLQTLWFAVRGAAAGVLAAVVIGLALRRHWHTPSKPEPTAQRSNHADGYDNPVWRS